MRASPSQHDPNGHPIVGAADPSRRAPSAPSLQGGNHQLRGRVYREPARTTGGTDEGTNRPPSRTRPTGRTGEESKESP